MSDTHGRVEEGDFTTRVPDGDVLLHAGDFTMYSDVDEYVAFNKFLGKPLGLFTHCVLCLHNFSNKMLGIN